MTNSDFHRSAGSVVVPREPTREMWAAMGDALVGKTTVHHDVVANAVYQAILSSTPAQPEQEPVAFRWKIRPGENWCYDDRKPYSYPEAQALYAAQPPAAPVPAQCSAGSEPVAWQCIDERYPYITGIVTDRHRTVEAWREGDIKFVGLGPINATCAKGDMCSAPATADAAPNEPQPLGVWQPIETAPKDGTPIEACNTRHPSHAPVIVRWDNHGLSEDIPEPHWCDAATRAGDALYYNQNYFDFWKPTSPLPRPELGTQND